MDRNVDFRQAFAAIVVATFLIIALIYQQLPDWQEAIFWLALIAPGLVPKRYIWIGFGMSGVILFVIAMISGSWKGGLVSGGLMAVAGALYLAAATLSYFAGKKQSTAGSR